MNKLHFVYLLFFLGAVYVTLSSHSGGMASVSNDDRTGAPGAGLCSNCHSGGAFGTASVKIEVFSLGTSNLVFSYLGGLTYDVRITVNHTSGTPSGYGFEMTCLTSPGNAPLAGYSNLAANVKQKTVTVGTYNGRTYTEHNGVTNNNVFSFRWTAPASGTGNVKFYAAGNCVNGNGSNSGDLAASSSLTLTELAPLSVSGNVTDVPCFAGTSGAIDITVANGSQPYIYNWGGGISTEDRTGLSAGTYSVTVTDNIGSTASASFTVLEPTQIDAPGNITHVSCFGGGNGSIDLSASGGTGTLSFTWVGGITTEDRNSLTAGMYTVTITDVNSCTTSAAFTISQPSSSVNVSAVVTNVSCFGGNNGAINITASGGTPPYTYNWGGGITSDDRILLSPGNYSVSVTDNNGCSASSSFTIIQPSSPLSVTGIVTPVSCNGANDGSIDITASGGTASYSYNWGSGITTEDRTQLTAGNYRVTVSDNNNCTSAVTFPVTQPAVLSIQHTQGTILCFGGSTTVNISATGGTLPYNGTGNFVVQAGTGNYTVTDSKGCSASVSVTVNQPPQLIATADTVTIPCIGGSGTITVSSSGGTPPYTGTGGFTVNNPGTFNYSVTDANGCTANATGTALSITGLTATGIVSGITCHDSCNASVSVDVAGGTQPYTFVWSNSLTTKNAQALCAGSYQQTISDASGCSLINNYIVSNLQPLQINISKDSVFCFGDSVNVIAVVTGGTPAYNFTWNTGATTSGIRLPAGNYTLSISDNNSCALSTSIIISQPPAISLSVATVTDDNGTGSGAINISATGGTLPHSFSWNNGETTEDISQLNAGTYSLTLTDANGCTSTIGNIAVISTGIENSILSGVIIFPNPVSDKLFITIPGYSGKPPMFRLVSVNGFVLREETLEGPKTILDISSLPKGMYFAEILYGGRSANFRILKAE